MIRWNKNVFIEENKGEEIISGIGREFYNPFDYDNLIPEFINLIEKVLDDVDLYSNLKKWHSEWGPLYDDFDHQTVEKFSEEALKFYALWNFYKAIANRDEEALLDYIEIIKDEDESEERGEDLFKIGFFLNNPLFKRRPDGFSQFNKKVGLKIFREIKDPDYYFDFKPTGNEEAEFKQCQETGMMFLFNQIEKYTNRANLTYGNFQHEQEQESSNFKVEPILRVQNLIDAIYLQLYILFSENEKKICPVCNKPFVPKRKDQKYCTNIIDPSKHSSCYLTAKSRRYRNKKEK
jgi:hypothetical protein